MGSTVIGSDFMRVLGDMPEEVPTTTGTGGWSIDMPREPAMWTHTAQELMDKYCMTDKIEDALGGTHYVKKNRLYWR